MQSLQSSATGRPIREVNLLSVRPFWKFISIIPSSQLSGLFLKFRLYRKFLRSQSNPYYAIDVTFRVSATDVSLTTEGIHNQPICSQHPSKPTFYLPISCTGSVSSETEMRWPSHRHVSDNPKSNWVTRPNLSVPGKSLLFSLLHFCDVSTQYKVPIKQHMKLNWARNSSSPVSLWQKCRPHSGSKSLVHNWNSVAPSSKRLLCTNLLIPGKLTSQQQDSVPVCMASRRKRR